MDLPARGAGLPDTPMLVSFDIDCGELVPGHHFVARGLASCEIPHPADVAAAPAVANQHHRARSGENYFVSFAVPPGGFTDADTSEDAILWRSHRSLEEAIARARRVPGVLFHYDLVPGLTQDEEDEDGFFPYLVEFSFTADRPLAWQEDGGGAMGPSVGGASTPGFEGPWPIPDGARLLMFELTGFDKDTGVKNDEPNGTLTVNLTTRTADWTTRT